jgi:hypothetical protein
VDRDVQRSEAARLYNACWMLLELPERTGEDDADLLTAAFASRHHWREVGSLEQWIIADWMVSRAAATIGDGWLAVHFAARAHEATGSPGTADWLVASTAEGLARAHLANGDAEAGATWRTTAERLAAQIEDEESRDIIVGQVASLPAAHSRGPGP